MGGGPGGLGEFDVIELFRSSRPGRPWVRDGIGDDCAVLDVGAGRALLVTTDMLVERVHFRLDLGTPRALGWKSLAVNVSDVAAMGGTPEAAFLALGFVRDLPLGALLGFRDGLAACAAAFGVDLLGGDTVSSRQDLVLCLTVLGTAAAGEVVRRSGAQAGDVVVAGGPVGDSAAGLHLLLAEADGCPVDLAPVHREPLLRAHLEPQPQVALGRALATRHLATAMIDVSDGVLMDLSHVCDRSGTGAVVEAAALPVTDACRAAAAALGRDPLAWALGGGEDYILIATVPPDRLEEAVAAAREDAGAVLRPIGTITRACGLRLSRDGVVVPVEPQGWDHFAS
jgi:thiamine-monophosphate kinase